MCVCLCMFMFMYMYIFIRKFLNFINKKNVLFFIYLFTYIASESGKSAF